MYIYICKNSTWPLHCTRLPLCMYIYVYIYIYMCVCRYICMYMYIKKYIIYVEPAHGRYTARDCY